MNSDAQWKRLRWWSVVVAALLATLAAAYLGPWNDGSLRGSLFNKLLYPAAGVFPTLAALIKARESRGGTRLAYVMAACAVCTGGSFGWLIAFWPELASPRTSPTVSIWFTVIIYVSGIVAVTWVAAERKSLTYVLDGLLISTSILFLTWHSVLAPILAIFEGDATATAIAMSGPMFDVIVFTMAVLAARRGTNVVSRETMLTFAFAEILDMISDMSWAYNGLGVPLNDLTLYFWVGYALMLSICFLVPNPDRSMELKPPSIGFMLFPYGPPVIAAGAASWMIVTRAEISYGTWVLGVIVALCLICRQLLAVLDNVRISQQLAQSVASLRARELELEHLAHHDALTSLPNRRYLSRRVMDRGAGAKDGFAVLLIDVDDFKQVNDGLGHEVGDALLMRIAEILKTCVRNDDIVARLGGDEFAALLHGASREQGLEVAERISSSLEKSMQIGAHTVNVSASIGLALGDDLTLFDHVLRQADMAMYERKRTNKGGVAVFAI